MLLKKLLTLVLSIFFVAALGAETKDYSIIVTTPGYTSIYKYDNQSFILGAKKDLRITAPIEVNESDCSVDSNSRIVNICIGTKEYNFEISEESPVVRLVYDRNRRVLTPVGFNCIDSLNVVMSAPVFKGVHIARISQVFADDVEKHITDKSLLSSDEPTFFLLEVDIDENGIVQNVVELNGELRQYSKIIIDRFYDKAFRGWDPAKREGIPARTVSQFLFKLKR